MAAPRELTFASLPSGVVLSIFGRLSLWERLRCEAVCHAWRAQLVADSSLWVHLDLTRADGTACSEALLRGAAARSGNRMQSLRLLCDGVDENEPDVFHDALCAVVASNAATLRELRLAADAPDFGEVAQSIFHKCEQLERLAHAAPHLRVFEAAARCDSTHDARRLLCNEPPFEQLRLCSFCAEHYESDDEVVALAEHVSSHASLTSLSLQHVPLDSPAALDAVVDAVLARRLTSVTLSFCSLAPASAPGLARLLCGNTLTELTLQSDKDIEDPLMDYRAAALLGAALRANTSLTALSLQDVGLFDDCAVGIVLLGSLSAHPSLRSVCVALNSSAAHLGPPLQQALGAALAAVVLANSPALHTLDFGYCRLHDAGLAPVIDALRHNTHLRSVHCGGNGMSAALAQGVLLPAVRANTGLHGAMGLLAGEYNGTHDAIADAQALVAARPRAL
jgi:hypothetical protein